MSELVGGVYPAMPVPFREDFSVDKDELARLADWLASHDGVEGLVTNGIAGEVFALSREERAEVTRTVVEATAGRVVVISGLYCERLEEAAEDGQAARSAGAAGLLVMPPGRWLRYGTNRQQVVDYFEHIGEATGLDLVVHMYPAATRAAYTADTIEQLAQMPAVSAFKIGTREMAQYEQNIRAIRRSSDALVLTCQDEFLLPSMVSGVDGAMVGFASFVPDLVVDLLRAVQKDDLKLARDVYERLGPLNRLVYGDDHPRFENYPRMKVAMKLTGRLSSDVVRPPIAAPDAAARDAIKRVLRDSGFQLTSLE